MKTNIEFKTNEWNEAEFIAEKDKTHAAQMTNEKWNENLKWIKHSQLCKMEKIYVLNFFWVSGLFFSRSAVKQ